MWRKAFLRNSEIFNSAVEVQVTRRESVDGWSKYQLIVLAIYKRDTGIRLRRGEQSLWISGKRTACKCPKIRVGRKYLILGAYFFKFLWKVTFVWMNKGSAQIIDSGLLKLFQERFCKSWFSLSWFFNICDLLRCLKTDFFQVKMIPII